jgi:hypothetical protein
MTGAARGCLIAGLLCLGDVARAEDAGADADLDARAGAERHLALGKAASDAGHFAVALDEFQAASGLLQTPRVLYNIAQVERALGRSDLALEHYQRFLSEIGSVPPEPDVPPRIKIAEGAIASLAAEVGAVDVGGDPGVEVLVDGQPRGRTPLGGPLRVMPGVHELMFRRAGLEVRRPVRIAAGQRLRAEGLRAPPPRSLPPAPAPPPASVAIRPLPQPAPRRPLYGRWYFWAGLGALAAVAGMAAVYLSSPRPPDCPPNATCIHR